MKTLHVLYFIYYLNYLNRNINAYVPLRRHNIVNIMYIHINGTIKTLPHINGKNTVNIKYIQRIQIQEE